MKKNEIDLVEVQRYWLFFRKIIRAKSKFKKNYISFKST